MRLINARLQRVRQHRLLELELAPGFSLIGGPNEVGKSTVVEALHKVLFLKATATGRGVEELRSQMHSGLPEVELRFTAAGDTWLLRKRFAGASGTCQLSNATGVQLQGSSAETRLAQLLQVSGPIEGRRIAQLPLRWAHLWVRQGEAGADLLASSGEAYDLPQLVQQLQRGSSDGARQAAAQVLESSLDRQVQALLLQRLEQQLTATGKVRAGSPLALAQRREAEAQVTLRQAEARQAELQAAMEQLQQIQARLEAIEPQRQQLAAAEPLQRQREHLLLQLRQHTALSQQRQSDQQQLTLLQASLSEHEAEIKRLSTALDTGEQQRQALQQQQQRFSLLADLAGLEREAAQLQRHKAQFEALQQQANAVKAQLQQLAAISPEQVRQLRQAEAQLAQLQARCQGMATTVELLRSDQPVRLAGQQLKPGQSLQLEQRSLLELGSGTQLQISPGGGTAMAEALTQRQQLENQLQQLQQSLGVGDSEAAERIAQQRQALEGELGHLRKTATTIPWAQLDQQLAALQPRRQRLQAALAGLGDAAAQPSDLDAASAALQAQQQQLERELAAWRQQRDGGQQQLQRQQGEAGRLAGAIASTSRQLEQLETQHGDAERLSTQLAALEQQLQASGAAALSAAAASAQLNRLQAEKETLLTSRGHNEQLCRSLGALDPAAEVEQHQAALEQAQAERQAIERTTTALQQLQAAFHQAQQQAAAQYCAPLQAALRGYLEALDPGGPGEALLDFDPQQGFADLRLQRPSATFGFDQLSGGMREQLGAALRLALAEVLQGAYDGCLPLVFDDAFSNCDPQRLAGVQRMLARGVEQGLQIVLLSCTPDDFGALSAPPGRRITLAPPEA